MDARKRAHMASLNEYIQWFIIICLMVVVGVGYVVMTMLMQQIDQLNDQMLRIISETPPPDNAVQSIREWRQRGGK